MLRVLVMALLWLAACDGPVRPGGSTRSAGADASDHSDASAKPDGDAGDATFSDATFSDATFSDATLSDATPPDAAADAATDPPDGGVLEGDSCANLEGVITAFPIVAQTLAGYRDDFATGAGCVGTAGADRAYIVRVGSGQTLRATITAVQGGFVPSISLQRVCSVAMARTCDASAVGGQSVEATNLLGVEDSFVVVVDGGSGGPGESFDLLLELVGGGDDCANAIVVPAGVLDDFSFDGFGDSFSGCGSAIGVAGPDRFFAVDVPAGGTLTARITPGGTSPFDCRNYYELGILAPCGAVGPLQCLGSGASPNATASASNSTGASAWLVVHTKVHSGFATRCRTFDLDLRVAP